VHDRESNKGVFGLASGTYLPENSDEPFGLIHANEVCVTKTKGAGCHGSFPVSLEMDFGSPNAPAGNYQAQQ